MAGCDDLSFDTPPSSFPYTSTRPLPPLLTLANTSTSNLLLRNSGEAPSEFHLRRGHLQLPRVTLLLQTGSRGVPSSPSEQLRLT